eukprot:CAMPEP_0119120938 /NCGR_PEP_ID=MMETSP1310-20130426/1770_1 /TAXON_ID=464262 /ORGANISM="Genus nov. species nov., Strain RCC2339" /LENGTH=374 /DNA_ID=CAMNT_0007110455 /DNA_START=279 /DNA_END=1403 /DNA_ORIENTATION=+
MQAIHTVGTPGTEDLPPHEHDHNPATFDAFVASADVHVKRTRAVDDDVGSVAKRAKVADEEQTEKPVDIESFSRSDKQRLSQDPKGVNNRRSGRIAGAKGYTTAEINALYTFVRQKPPVDATDWAQLAERYNSWAKTNKCVCRTGRGLKDKLRKLARYGEGHGDDKTSIIQREARECVKMIHAAVDGLALDNTLDTGMILDADCSPNQEATSERASEGAPTSAPTTAPIENDVPARSFPADGPAVAGNVGGGMSQGGQASAIGNEGADGNRGKVRPLQPKHYNSRRGLVSSRVTYLNSNGDVSPTVMQDLQSLTAEVRELRREVKELTETVHKMVHGKALPMILHDDVEMGMRPSKQQEEEQEIEVGEFGRPET